jgi:hypothetical protein
MEEIRKKKLKIAIQNGMCINTICKIDDDKLNGEHNYNALLIIKAQDMLEMLIRVEDEQSKHGYVTSDTHSEIIELIKEATEI